MRMMLVSLVMVQACLAAKVDVLFLGVLGGGAPSLEQTYEARVREQFAASDTLQLIDQVRTREFQEAVSFGRPAVLSPAIQAKIREYFNDSTLVIWVGVRRWAVQPVRAYGFTCRAQGELEITLSIYSLLEKGYLFTGQVRCVDSRYHGLLFFTPAAQEHVTATEQASLIDGLCDMAAQRTARLLHVVLRSVLTGRELAQQTEVEKEKEVSSTIFKVPYTEGDSVTIVRPDSAVAPADTTTGIPADTTVADTLGSQPDTAAK